MGWYGHLIIFGTMGFFHFGGRAFLRKNLPAGAAEKGKKTKIDTAGGKNLGPTPTWKVQPPSPIDPPPQPREEMDDRDLKWVRHALDNEQTESQGKGFAEEVVRGQPETPGLSRSGSPEL
jgi:lysophospholipid acyltransferase